MRAPARARPPELLPCLALPLERVQVQTDGRRLHGEKHVQLGESLGVLEELRVRLRPLPATRDRLAPHEHVEARVGQ